MATGSEKRTPWWNQDVKETIKAKKDVFKALLQNKSSFDLQSQYLEVRKSAAQAIKMFKKCSWEKFGCGWILSIHQQTKYFGRPFADCVGKV